MHININPINQPNKEVVFPLWVFPIYHKCKPWPAQTNVGGVTHVPSFCRSQHEVTAVASAPTAMWMNLKLR